MSNFTAVSKSSNATLTHTTKTSAATFTNATRPVGAQLWSSSIQPWQLQYTWHYDANASNFTYLTKN